MPGSPKKRAKRAAAGGSPAGARARGIAPVPPQLLPTDAQLVAIAKGVLLGVSLNGCPADQVRAAWQLADVARRTAQPVHNDLETMPSEELELLAAQAQAQLHGERQ
jgi:hypothetical protein